MKTVSEKLILKSIKKHEDPRGWFAEIIRSEELPDKNFGQISLTVAKANQNKGGHFHKIRYEWFVVIKGEIQMSLHHTVTEEKKQINISANNMKSLCIPPLWFHSIKNIGEKEDAIVLLYSSIPHDPEKPDVYVNY